MSPIQEKRIDLAMEYATKYYAQDFLISVKSSPALRSASIEKSQLDEKSSVLKNKKQYEKFANNPSATIESFKESFSTFKISSFSSIEESATFCYLASREADLSQQDALYTLEHLNYLLAADYGDGYLQTSTLLKIAPFVPEKQYLSLKENLLALNIIELKSLRGSLQRVQADLENTSKSDRGHRFIQIQKAFFARRIERLDSITSKL
jgi:hypothetical protein